MKSLNGSVLEQYDRDAYAPVYDRDSMRRGKVVLIGVNRRPQEDVDRRKALRAMGNPVPEPSIADAEVR